MDPRGIALSLALAAFATGSACAMNAPPPRDFECTVERGEILPAASGGAAALCADIKAAMAPLSAPPTKVSVRIVSAHSMAATVTVGSAQLPVLRIDRSDRELSRSAFRRFAQSIAAASASARGQ